MPRELSPKQRELYETLRTKTGTGRIDWKADSPTIYFFEIKDYRIVVSLTPEGHTTVVVRQGSNDGKLLTSFTVPCTDLFYDAQNRCSERNTILKRIIQYLDEL